MWLLTFKEYFVCKEMTAGMTDEKNDSIVLLNHKKNILSGVFTL